MADQTEPAKPLSMVDPSDTCQDGRCSRIDGRCVGCHCAVCGKPCGMLGHESCRAQAEVAATDQTETAGAEGMIDEAARVIHDAIATELEWAPGGEPEIVDLAAARALARRGQLADPEQRTEIERLGARLDAARLNASDAERIANDLRAERDFALWLYAELDHQVRAALHGLDSELPDDAPLGARVDELHESYMDAVRLASEHLTDYQQRNRQLFERTVQRDEVLRERNALERERDQLKARIATITEILGRAAGMMATDSRDWSLDRSDVWLYGLIVGWECEARHEHDDVMCGGDSGLREVAAQHGWAADDIARLRRFRAALQGDQPAEPDAKPRCYVPGPPEEVPGG